MSENTEAPQAEESQYVQHEVGELRWFDPRTLVVDPFNHRKNRDGEPVTADPDLIASVAERGVETPVTVRPQADGSTLGVIKGQRRLLAAQAVAAKAAKARKPVRKIPAFVREDLAGVDDEALVGSVIENTHRRAASTRDTVEALTLLDGMDLTPAARKRHARVLGYKPEEVAAAQRVAALPDDELRIAVNSFDLVEAADYAEVADNPSSLGRLRAARQRDAEDGKKGRGHWEHTMAQLRQDKAEAEARRTIETELRDNAVTIVRAMSDWGWDNSTTVRPLTHLLTVGGKRMTRAQHAKTCQHHAAYIDREKIRAVYACADWQAAGHQLTPEKAALFAQPEQRDRAAEVAERRAVIKGNREWRAAREVRQQFISALIADKRGISEAAWLLMMRTMSGTSYLWHHFTGRRSTELVAKFLGVTDPNEGRSSWDVVDDPFEAVVGRTPKARRGSFLFAQVAAAWEDDAMGDRAWRSVQSQTVEWLRFLVAEGYTLSEIEAKAMTGASEEQPDEGAPAGPDAEAVQAPEPDEEACDHDAEAEDAEQADQGDQGDQGDEAEDAEIRRQQAHADCIEPHRNSEGEYVDCDGRPI